MKEKKGQKLNKNRKIDDRMYPCHLALKNGRLPVEVNFCLGRLKPLGETKRPSGPHLQ